MIRALLIGGTDDDRSTLARWLEHDGDIQAIDASVPAAELPGVLDRVHPDLVVADAETATTAHVAMIAATLQPHSTPIIALIERTINGSAEADDILSAGAAEVLPRTQLRLTEPGAAQAVTVRHRMRRHVRARRGASGRSEKPVAVARPEAARTVIAICASTGGPPAIEQVLAALPGGYPLPILVVQHIADGFMHGFVEWLNTRVEIPVALARDGMDLTAGVWFAPDHADLILLPTLKLALREGRQDQLHCPSADALLESMAAAVGRDAIAVVLTGMGRDGGDGVAALRQRGARVIAQDEASSVIFGMPKTAIERGAQLVLSLSQVAPELLRIAQDAAQ